jgi:hypothetical protein
MQNKKTKQKPAINDDYKGVKKETTTIIIKDKDGKITKIKI